MRVVTDDGVGLEVRVRGDGPGLVLVHGFGGAKEDFDDHVEALARRTRVVTFDHRGHGESDWPTDVGAYSLDRLADDVRRVADACDLGTFRLLGHSMGGMAARRLALTTPDRVRGLVLMDTSSGPVDGIDPAMLDAAAEVALRDGMDVLKDLLDTAAPLETPAYQRLMDERPGYSEFQDAKWNALSPVMWAALGRDIAYQPSQLELLEGIACPVLVVVGDQDAPFLADSRRMAAKIPGADLVVIPGAGHSPQFENPDAWFEALSRFLDRVDVAEPTARV